MRIVQINAVPYGSTGRIMFSLADALKNQRHDVLCTAGFTWKGCDRKDFFVTSNIWEKKLHTVLAAITGKNGCYSILATRKLLRRLDEFQPDLIHLHNLHCWFLNLPMFFDYIKQRNIPIIWTLHDCWSFTGHCPHFEDIGCERWKNGCHTCGLYKQYPRCLFDDARKQYELKKQWFTGVDKLTLVTPSQWLAKCVKDSFLSNYPVRIIPNGIDLDTFSSIKPTKRSNGPVVLGVAYAWDRKKGLDIFIKLREWLPDHYKIVLVGTDDKVDKMLPQGITSIHRTQDQHELAMLYSSADVFVNPTREDNFPTVNIEALACGTPVITFRTGGSPEIPDDTCGSVVEKDDTVGLLREIRRICEEKPYSRQQCRKRAELFSTEICLQRYLELYGSEI